jgi:predicted NBD/HSP70 family sugar kinase
VTFAVAGPTRGDPRRVLVLDIGGSHVKIAFSHQTTETKIPTGPTMTPARMMREVLRTIRDEPYDAVAIGFPGPVRDGKVAGEPPNLGRGWVGFDFAKALRRPTRVLNDAVLQALGGYRGGRMLYLGLGTGLGTAMILDGTFVPMELAHLPYKKGREYEGYVGEAALERFGHRKWQKEVFEVVQLLYNALEPDYVTIGGGNAHRLKTLPPHCLRGDNRDVILGGVRLWTKPFGGPSGRRGAGPSRKGPGSRKTARGPRV